MAPSHPNSASSSNRVPRPWVGAIFHCHGAYGRLYYQEARDLWVGYCSVCAQRVQMTRREVGPVAEKEAIERWKRDNLR